MNGTEFLDTNVLVHSYDDSEPTKQNVARDYVRGAVAGEYVISMQALMELAATQSHRFSATITADRVIRILDALSGIRTVQPDRELVRRGTEASAQYGVHFCDGMIIAAAERAGCKTIWSEDLNAGQEYFGAKVANPFV